MISEITGIISFRAERFVIINTGGLGYKVFVTNDVLLEISKETSNVRLFTHLAVRENALDLYGFLSMRELRFFELLLTVSGVGPKTALSIMNVAPLQTLLSGIASGESTYFTKVSGLGKKTAQKIILELKDKVGAVSESSENRIEETDVLDAIQALGYSLRDAHDAYNEIAGKEEKNTNEKIREALKILGGKK